MMFFSLEVGVACRSRRCALWRHRMPHTAKKTSSSARKSKSCLVATRSRCFSLSYCHYHLERALPKVPVDGSKHTLDRDDTGLSKTTYTGVLAGSSRHSLLRFAFVGIGPLQTLVHRLTRYFRDHVLFVGGSCYLARNTGSGHFNFS